MIVVFLVSQCSLVAQETWDWKDPNDFQFIDLADNKLLAYNLLGYGLVEIFDKTSARDSTKSYQLSVARYREYRRAPLSDITTLSYSGSKDIRDYFSLGLSSYLYSMHTEGDWTQGIGGRLWFGWHIIRKSKFWLTYDNGVGPNYFSSPFPAGGTRFNFTSHYGLKMSIKHRDNWISLRLSNIHISNANIKGRDKNPALDAIGIRLSWQW